MYESLYHKFDIAIRGIFPFQPLSEPVFTQHDTTPLSACISTFPMSTAIDARRRPNLWSYISFSSSPRRRSGSLPTRNSHHDPYEKADRHYNNGSINGPTAAVERIQEAWMTQSQRSRYLKAGGIIAFFVFLFFLFSPYERSHVPGLSGGMRQFYK